MTIDQLCTVGLGKYLMTLGDQIETAWEVSGAKLVENLVLGLWTHGADFPYPLDKQLVIAIRYGAEKTYESYLPVQSRVRLDILKKVNPEQTGIEMSLLQQTSELIIHTIIESPMNGKEISRYKPDGTTESAYFAAAINNVGTISTVTYDPQEHGESTYIGVTHTINMTLNAVSSTEG
ncbi:MAG: hypothetical protein GY832_31005 [Chloroflexi bacterium]|nr:hypothetical protein [Chloroflexota bacterium]